MERNGPLFFAGDVYALGGPFGDRPVYIDDIDSLLNVVDTFHRQKELLSSFESNWQRFAISYSGRVSDRWEWATTTHYDAFRLESPDSLYCLGELLDTSQVREKTRWTSGLGSYGTDFFKALGHQHLVVNAIDERITVPAGTLATAPRQMSRCCWNTPIEK